MSLSLSLNTALSGLRVNRESLAVLSQNIANANNPNYSRKVISQSSQTLDGVGSGVNIDDVSRKIDTYLQQAIRTQTSVAGRASTMTDYAERLQLLLGSPGANTGLNSFVTNAFNAFQSLAETPERSSNRVNVVNAAQSLVDEIGQITSGIQQLRFDADQAIQTSVNTVNLRLNELAGLNRAIANATVLGRPTSELQDKQDAAIREISEHIDVNIFQKDDGSISIYARGGAILLDLNAYEIGYTPITSPEALYVDDPQFSAIQTFLLDGSGNRVSRSVDIATGGSSDEVAISASQGRIKALIETRDETLPGILEQIDSLVATLRDEVNAAHNAGSGIPGDRQLTGTRSTTSDSFSNWAGQVRIGLVDSGGLPIISPYGNEVSPARPLTIDLSRLDSGLGNGPGSPDVQTIINEINNYYAIPRNKVSLGNLNNISLASTTQQLPGGFLSFDFDLENISGEDAQFFVNSVTVLDDTGADITSVTNTVPSISLNPTATYTTTADSNTVAIAASAHGLSEGDYVYLPTPSTGVGGLGNGQLGGVFQVTNVTPNGFDINVSGNPATSSAALNEAGEAFTTYYDSATGTYERTTANGGFRADLIGNISSDYYDVQASVAVVDADGTVSTSTVTYRIASNEYNLYNKRYGAMDATGTAQIESPVQRTQPYARAKLVDANGVEVPQINGRYIAGVEGFLQIETANSSHFVSIDSLNSSENGNPNGSPFVVPGSQRGFSHYFELNNFFSSNAPTSTGDTVEDSARNFAIEQRIRDNPSNISTGKLVQSIRSADPGEAPLYSYERITGDDSVAQRLADLGGGLVTFSQAGGLSGSRQTLSGYAGEILGFAGAGANSAESNFSSAQIILQGFSERSSAISGVNLDEELANTIIYQNAYTASARVITVTNELFETLLNTF